jgi:hypothetical protein
MPAVLGFGRRLRANSLAACRHSRSLRSMRSRSLSKNGQGQRGLVVAERYVSRAELAVLMGVSLATVDRLVAEGMPSGDVGASHAAV